MKRVAWLAAILFTAPPVLADAGWLESGDPLLRLDLQLLVDAHVIRLPVNQWPIPRAAVQQALRSAKEGVGQNAAVTAALARVRRQAGDPADAWSFGASVSGGDAALLRDFDSLARADGELSARAAYTGERAAVSLRVTAAGSDGDEQSLRADGSHATVALGNWLLSANTLDRYWGPSHESSLILSNNARPMPTFSVERATALPFESRWLSWLGPWRFNFAISQMESDRQDVDRPLFMAWRVSIMPTNDIELGFSRTAQFCGKELACDFNSFFNMLAGNDNLGIDATAENEPGNQMAGFDIRWNSPIGTGPYAIYGQSIGEDESSYLPAKFLMQFGLETWKPLASGALLQGFIEYADTTCSATSKRGPYFNCAYNQGLFDVEGYRYRGRVIGYTTDRDSETWSLGATLVTTRGDLWSATVRHSDLNREGGLEPEDTVSPDASEYGALELGWRGQWFGEAVAIELGVESLEPLGAERDVQPYGFLRWTHDFGR